MNSKAALMSRQQCSCVPVTIIDLPIIKDFGPIPASIFALLILFELSVLMIRMLCVNIGLIDNLIYCLQIFVLKTKISKAVGSVL
jgi:hypothetical protein